MFSQLMALALSGGMQSSAVDQPAPSPPACAASENRQFDFWVGKWDVFDPKTNKKVAESLIESVYRGCGIRENWRPKTSGGGSLNIYIPQEKKWFQSWIDAQGSRAEFVGGWNGKAMVLEGDWPTPAVPGQPNRVRMTYTPYPDGSVRQTGEVSTDDGKTWKPSFDFIYRHAAEGEAK
ncbi:hypothetical protein FPZ24_02120 [Sphingomonas panacisoli]|uniref:DUF1579 domain-containing protein n=1 Tax=Sphingomonas panacisoli TaxID=1813879 RepID=A0A5B8LE06_9SPHN|nr:hypothetical protein [Sphingomonas panacisoli]QDZ06418.1 hypothetical protein FPZ24_02120 [Sphingomonas panacisoli]